MAKIQMKALKLGYVDHKRVREGQVFWIDEKDTVKGSKGEILSPKWAEVVGGKKQKAEVVEDLPKAQDKSDEVL
jgi:hypothetical protein